MLFEWDENKRRVNLNKHGLDFVDGQRLFDGRPVITAPASSRGEERWMTVGRIEGRYLCLIWTLRAASIRIISFRRARVGEERAHGQLHG
jgi:uncharacterized DUF497 family protein